ncbi:MAG: aspartate aminotransferase family protein [Syntrophales bacterium]|jgi:acetylornithine/N-succinyldiaminopimelate aminotransferase|nr:aspartate aminotransferase family protein [Syntrophales bacterium]MCK9390038.1 aspartate aminotransferase family protein [Syntrophales bacterium]
MTTSRTIHVEDKYTPPFFRKIPVSIERGAGVHVWDEEGNRFIDFTSGWGVTCLGHAHPVITDSLLEQSKKIIQNPNSGLTYSSVRARLLSLMSGILPPPLTRVFFSNSGAEANDAAIKLARKATGRLDVIAMDQSFHGRTISTTSATGQTKHREKYNPLMPNYRFVPYNDLEVLKRTFNNNVAALILEPIQGEGGVIIPADGYLKEVSRLCKANGSLLIIDEIQTGFCRTGPMFAIGPLNIEADFMTMAKGIAGGFPFGAFAISEAVAAKLEPGDHGGTYCGNPLGCAVAYAVIKYLLDHNVSADILKTGVFALDRMHKWMRTYPEMISDVRGRGLLLAIEFSDEKIASDVADECLAKYLFVRQTQGNMIRIFPALNIKQEEMEEGLMLLEEAIDKIMRKSG